LIRAVDADYGVDMDETPNLELGDLGEAQARNRRDGCS
jgi:hypothetical protein